MAFLNIGTVTGLGFQQDWDAQIRTAQQNELLDQQARITAENKAMLLGDKFKMAHANNVYDNRQLKEFSEQKIKEMGTWITQNRDFQRNPSKWAYFSAQSDSLLNNDIVDRSMRYDTNKNALTKFIQENPDAINEPEIQQQLTESENYAKYGSVDGVEGGGAEFMFRSPDINFDPNAIIANTFGSLKQRERQAKPGETVGVGGMVKEVPVEIQLATATAILNGKDSRKMMAYWNKMSEEDKIYYDKDPRKWVMETGAGFVGRDLTQGQVWSPDVYARAEQTKEETRLLRESGGKKASTTQPPPPPAYDIDFGSMKKGESKTVPAKNIQSIIPVQTTIQENFFYDINGVSYRAISLNGRVIEPKATGNVKIGPNGKMAEVLVKVKLTSDIVGPDKFITGDSNYYGEPDINDYQEDAKKPYYSIGTGDDEGFAFVKGWTPLPENTATIRAYNDAAQGIETTNKNEAAGATSSTSNVSQTIRLSGSETQQQTQVNNAPSGTIFILGDGSKYTKP